MKKFIILLLVILFSVAPKVMAADADSPSSGDLWDNWGTSQDMYGQDKSVSDEEFNKVIDKLKEKKDKLKNRFKKNPIPKGEEFSQSNETEVLTEHAEKDTSLPVICIPVDLKIGDGVLPVGHYQIKGEKDGNNLTLNFYQAQHLMAKIPAIETTDDFGEETITFANWKLESVGKLKIIYGSMEFNAYTFVDINN